jgi:hypothetical protein
MKYFCTLFDRGYLIKGLAMMTSLVANCNNVKIYVLCMDMTTYDILTSLNFNWLECIKLEDVEDERLLEVKKDRGVAEYCWTLSPVLPTYILKNNSEINYLTYLDADLYFYSSVDPIFKEIENSSVAIIEHRFTERLKDRIVNGRFCVEWVSFKRDEEGLACLSRWREQCIEWCFYRLEDNKMGDQKYLDEWPSLYPNCKIIEHLGAGVAPWNYAQYTFDTDSLLGITVENVPLIFYHFHQFQLLDNGKFDRLSDFYTSEKREPERIYVIYEEALAASLALIRKFDPGFKWGLQPVAKVRRRRFVQEFAPRWMKEFARKFLRY